MKQYTLSDIGRARSVNQDFSFATGESVGNLPNLYIVADGMGGHKAGDFASRFTVDHVVSFIKNCDYTSPIMIFREAVRQVNNELFETACASPDLQGTGTTLVLATVIDKILYVSNVGDSRLYLFQPDMHQVTRDHSYVEEMVRLGKLERDSDEFIRQRNIITRAVGINFEVIPDIFEEELKDGATILMCTDGLVNMVSEEEIKNVVSSDNSLEEKASDLIRLANESGGKDNITVLLAQSDI